MNNPKNTQYLVLSPRAYDSGWNRTECHTEAEAFAVAADLAERGTLAAWRPYIVDIAGGTCLPFIRLAQASA
jgi:hypothetical protein